MSDTDTLLAYLSDPVTVTDLKDRLGWSRPRVTRTIRKLAEAGAITTVQTWIVRIDRKRQRVPAYMRRG